MVVSPSKILRKPSSRKVIMPSSTAFCRTTTVGARSLISVRIASTWPSRPFDRPFARPDSAAAKVAAAYTAGCRRFDSALAGLGGCPFAQDTLVGNLATEVALAELRRLGAVLPSLRPLDDLLADSRSIQGKFDSMAQ